MSDRREAVDWDAVQVQLRRLRPRGASLDLEAILAAAWQPKPADLISCDRHRAAVPHTLGGGFSPWYNLPEFRCLPAPLESHSMNEESFPSLIARADVLVKANRFSEALVLLQQAEQIARRDGKESDLAKALSLKSLCLAKLGRTLEAEQAGAEVDALVLREPRRQLDVASFASLMAKATILIKEERNLEALESLEIAEAIARRNGDEKGLVSVLSLKSRCLYKLGRSVDAEQANNEAVTLELKQRRKFARAFETQQKYADAEREYREALRICEKNFGTEHPETATCMTSLAGCLRRQGRFHEALTYAKPALEARLRIFGLFHHHTADGLWEIGLLYAALARFEEADDTLGKSRVVREKLFGPDHPCVADSLAALAWLRRQQGRFNEAIELGERALQIRMEKLGPDHVLTAASRHNLAKSREHRPLDDKAEAVDADGSSCEPCSADLPKVVMADLPKLPRQHHGVGYWIVGACFAFLSAAIAIFWFVPQIVAGLAVVVSVFVVAVIAMRVTGIESPLDETMRRGADRIKSIGGRGENVDRNKVILGQPSDAARDKIAGFAKLGVLEVDTALEIMAFCKATSRETLDFPGVHSISLAAADVVAKHPGTLKLNALVEFRSKLAKSLVSHKGRLELNGVTTLTKEAAANIRNHKGDLCFNGLGDLPYSVAEHLAYHKGRLELNGVRTMEERAASCIIRHRGLVQLHGLKLISSETRRILKSSPYIEFPSDDQAA